MSSFALNWFWLPTSFRVAPRMSVCGGALLPLNRYIHVASNRKIRTMKTETAPSVPILRNPSRPIFLIALRGVDKAPLCSFADVFPYLDLITLP
jgi:hypothetical protein